jgi:hypothetical protein
VGLRYAALFVGLAASVTIATYAANPAAAPKPPVLGVQPPQGQFSATVGCSAASCHGSGETTKLRGEHSTWMDSDPHTRAYQVLLNEDSVRISKNLGRAVPAHEDAQCLKCHALNEERHYNGEPAGKQLNEGVGCESCHGPSVKWNNLHYLPFWKSLSDREKFEEFGFVPTKDPVARVLTCAQCHVGGRDREVNHDLIAAGHPRLSFEYTRYHYSDKYRQKHWEEKVPNPDFEVRTWLVGQVASLRAAVDLLAARAERAEAQKAPWPEFAESSCYACHQNLGQELRGHTTNALKPRKAGLPGWQLWYGSFAKALPKLAGVIQPAESAAALSSLSALRTEMEKPVPSQTKVASFAKATTAELDAWLQTLQAGTYANGLTGPQLKQLGAIVTENVYDKATGKLRDYDWDVLAQHALALTAIYHAAGGKANPAVAAWTDSLVDLRTKLAFPTTGTRVDSPRDFKPNSVYDGFKKLHDLTH